MSSSIGPLSPSTAADAGGGGGAWTNPNNAKVSDGSYASGNISSGGAMTNDLFVTGYGFNVPPAATITGILVEVERNGTFAKDLDTYLLKAGSIAGSNKAINVIWPTTASGYQSYGGDGDLWGTTWTPAQINASNFGVAFAAQNTTGGGNAFVDHIRVTVFYTVGPLATNANLPKRYLYKVYNNGNYLGALPYVITEFQVAKDINTAGSQITVECAVSADTSALASVSAILDESGGNVQDENSENITSEGSAPLIGLGTGNSLIKNGNQVVVWEYSYYHPLGIPMFRGQIGRWEALFGGGGEQDKVSVVIYSDGQDLDNHLVRGSPFSYTLDQTQTAQNAAFLCVYYPADLTGGWDFPGNTFTTGMGVTNLGAISLLLNGTATVTVQVFASSGSTTPLATVTQFVSVGVPTEIQFSFPAHIPVVAATQYFFSVTVAAGQSIYVYYDTANPYGGGQMYENSYAGGGGGGSWSVSTGNDLYFKTYSSNGSTVASFSAQDPTTGILVDIMNDYAAEGGLITYTTASIEATGLSIPYDFNTNTVYEGIQAILTVSPSGFYYYVDLGTNVLNFKQASVSADLKLTKGTHLESINIVATIEQIKNMVYFSGGVVAGSNLYRIYQDAASIAQYGQRLERKTDNRVTVTGTANAIGDSAIAQGKNEQYQTVVTVLDKTMDITTLRPGLVVGFNGFGTFIDSLLAQIVRVDYRPEHAILTLGILPKRIVPSVEQITRGLVALNTIGNPTSPS